MRGRLGGAVEARRLGAWGGERKLKREAGGARIEAGAGRGETSGGEAGECQRRAYLLTVSPHGMLCVRGMPSQGEQGKAWVGIRSLAPILLPPSFLDRAAPIWGWRPCSRLSQGWPAAGGRG